MQQLIISLLIVMTFFEAQCQPSVQLARQVFAQHDTYKEQSLRHRRFTHRDIVPYLTQLRQNPLFTVEVVGQSVEGRDIYLVKAGSGKTKVMLWSQMHGDEPTATMALFDLLHFLQQSDAFDPIRQQLLQETTLYFVPMLNPDGAEQFMRRNALQIDLNRDALRLQSPEARLLKSLRDSLNPAFGFNLHDQSRYYTVGTSSEPATISFLAPPFDHARTVDPVRERAMRTIAGINAALQQLIPGKVAKYPDEHEPRAFGDNIQKWGTSVILVESGGYPNDPEKQYIRRLNFAALVAGLHLIATKAYSHYDKGGYDTIPENGRYLYDLVVRRVRYQQKGQYTLLDIGILRDEVAAPTPQGYYLQSSVQEIGDMRVFYGYEEVDGAGLTLLPGQVYEKPLKNLAALSPTLARRLLAQGYTTVRLENLPGPDINPLSLPLNVTGLSGHVNHALGMGRGADFVLQTTDGQVRYAIVNGFVYDLQKAWPDLFHGLVL